MNFTQKDLINVNQRHNVRQRSEPKIDSLITELVGKPVRTTDQRLIKLIVKWKSENAQADDSTDTADYLQDPIKVKELKQAFI